MMDCTVAGFRLCVLWRQAADGVLLMMVLACLYFLARLQGTDVDNMPQGCPASLELEGRADIIGDRLLKEIAMGMTGHTVLVPIDVKAAETGTVRKLKQIKGETLSVQGMSALASIPEEAPQKEEVAETPLLTICLYGNGGMPQKMVYTCKNDNIAVDSFQKPRRLGKEF